jgi:L-ribulose-5-phosphate 4-epimerase
MPCLGTTHADHFRGPVPVTRALTAEEIRGDYEVRTGDVIVETLEGLDLDPLEMPAALVASHGPFAWGADVSDAVENAIALEAVAASALRTELLRPSGGSIGEDLLERHFSRKHGPQAYYGQDR